MTALPRAEASRIASRLFSTACVAALIFAAAIPVRAQQPQAEPPARIIVSGEGSVQRGAGLCRDRLRRHHQGEDREGSDGRQLKSDGRGRDHAARRRHRAKRHPDHAVFAAAGLCAAAAQHRGEAHRLFRVQSVPGDDPSDRRCRRHPRPADRGGSDRRRQRRVSAFRHLEGARPSARGGDRRCAPQGGTLRASRGAHPRQRRLDHRGFRLRADRPLAATRLFAPAAAVPIAIGEDTLRVRLTVGFGTAH